MENTDAGEENLSVKLFVGGLSWQTEEEQLQKHFCQFGGIDNVQIMRDPFTLRSRGFGFITFSCASSLEKVLAISSHIVDGKKIDPKPATPKSKSKEAKTRKIFVGGVSQETSSEEVKKYFSQYGGVEDAVMLMDQITKRHRGFGFVTFQAEETVDIVCDMHYHTIKNKKVEVKKAQPKECVLSASNAALVGRRLVMLPAPAAATAAPAATSLVNIPLLQQQTAALQQHQNLSLNSQIGKMLPSSSSLSSLRYSPYQSLSPAAAATPSLQHLQGLQQLQYTPSPQFTATPTTPAIDLSHLTSGLDWSQLGIISLQ